MQEQGITNAGSDHRCYGIGEFVLDIDRAALLRNGEPVPLRPKSMAVLLFLVERPGVLVSKAELLAGVWPGLVVSEDSLTQCMIDVRRALGDEKKETISTVRGRGYRLEAEVIPFVSAMQPPAPATDARFAPVRWVSAHRLPVVFAVLLLAGAVFTLWRLPAPVIPGGVGTGATPLHSIAVLAFEDMSPNGNWEYFGDGIAEEVLFRLAKMPQLRVIARTSSFAFKGRPADVATIAERLQVTHVLEGSVRVDGSKVRVTAQLIRPADAGQLWSGAFTRSRNDSFGVQREIAEAVAEALELTLFPIAKNPPDSRAWEYYLRGRFLHHRRGPGDPQRALALFHQALDKDPELAEAWLGTAASLLVLAGRGERAFGEVVGDIRFALDRALVLAPGNAEALARKGARYYYSEFDPQQAQHYFSLALENGPNDAMTHAIIGGAEFDSHNYDRAIELLEQAVVLDPLSTLYRDNLANYYLQTLHLEAARREFTVGLELSPDLREEYRAQLARILVLEQRYEKAWALAKTLDDGLPRQQLRALSAWGAGARKEWAAAVAQLEQTPTLEAAVSLAEVHALAGDDAAVFKWLEILATRYLDSGELWRHRQHINAARFSPFLAPLRENTRLQQWEQRIHEVYRARSLTAR